MDTFPNLITVPLRGSVNAGATSVIVSNRLNFAYRTRFVWLAFELNTNRTVTAEFFVSEDPGNSTTEPNLGRSFFAAYSPTLTLVGDDQAIQFGHVIVAPSQSSWLKLRLINSDGFAHNVDALIQVEPLDEKYFGFPDVPPPPTPPGLIGQGAN